MAATSNVKLTLESQEYEKKLKRAANELANFTVGMRKAGETAKDAETRQMAFAKALGGMETSAKDARGRINELSKAFTEASLYYKRLTDAEKQTPFGKELSKSVETLKGRLNEAKTELASVTGESTKQTSAIGDLVGKYGTLATALAAGSAALKVAKDAFFASEANIDEWGRTVEAGKSIYEGFLTALNTGDISGYLSRIDQIASAAREAYDELDRLGTQKAMNNKQMQMQKAENERMQTMLRTGRYIAPVDGRQASMAEGTKLTQQQLERIAKQLQNGMVTINKIVKDEVVQTTKTIESFYNKEAKNLGMSKADFKAGTANMTAFDERMAGYKAYEKWRRENTTYTSMNTSMGVKTIENYDESKNPYRQYKAWGTFKDDGETFKLLNDLINQRAAAESQYFSGVASSYRAVNKVERAGASGSGKSTKEVDLTFHPLKDSDKGLMDMLAKADASLGTSVELGLTLKSMDGNLDKLNMFRGQMQTGTGDHEGYRYDSFRENLRSKYGKDKSTEASLTKQGSQILSGISGICGSLEQMGVEIPEGIRSAVSTLQGIMGIVSSIATVISAIQTIQTASLLKVFATGGIAHAANGFIGGNNPSGDLLPIMVNSGELILNKAQQGNLASQLSGTGFGALNLSATISGEQIRLALNNNSRRRGKGEYLTSRR